LDYLNTAVELNGNFVILCLEVEQERLARLKADHHPALSDRLVQVTQPSLYSKQATF
jgi:hypothetical protein